MQDYADYDRAAGEFLGWIREGFATRVEDPTERVLTIAVDGENAWGSYRNDARAFLRGLYSRLNDDPDLVAVTPSEFIAGDADRGVKAHPVEEQYSVSPLFTASWIDEMGSPHGNDLNIWIGSPQENRAWEVLGTVRRYMDEVGATPDEHPEAFESLYAAEGSDWFWWFGDDFVLPQGVDWMFDMLFRDHLKNVYRSLGEEPPEFLDEPIVRKQMLWTKDEPVRAMEPGQLLRIMSGAPGTVKWSLDRWKTSATRTLRADRRRHGQPERLLRDARPVRRKRVGRRVHVRRGGRTGNLHGSRRQPRGAGAVERRSDRSDGRPDASGPAHRGLGAGPPAC